MGSRRLLGASYLRVLLSCSCLAPLAWAGAASAQATSPGSVQLDEVVVTAQKRAQNLQDVPISITAVTQETLQANRITNVQDLNSLAPNMTVRPAAGAVGIPAIAMRGVSSYGSTPGTDKEISIYIDGVYVGSAQGSAFELPDLDRIEVLRGPQGTLFGRNATAGAVSIITRDPPGRFGVRQEVTVGNLDQIRSRTRIDFPAWGPLSATVNYVHDQRDGDIKNLGAGQVWDRTGPRTRQGVQVSPKTLGAKNADLWFVAVKFEPNDTFNTVYKFDWMENHSTPDGTAIIGVNPAMLGPLGAVLTSAIASNPVAFADAHRPKYVNNSWATGSYSKVLGHNVTTNLRVSDNLSLKNILAYRQSFIYGNSQISGLGGLVVTPQMVADPVVAGTLAALNGVPFAQVGSLVGGPFSAVDSQATARAKQWSDELQLNYDSKYLTLTSGAVYFHINAVGGAPDGLPGTTFFSIFPGGRLPLGPRTVYYNYATSLAAYTQAEVHVLPQLDIVGGYRITQDKKSGTAFLPATTASFDYKKTKPSYMAGVNYRPVEGVLTYAKYANGFVSGGSVGGVGFSPETVRSWEAGVKADLLQRRLRVNLALFRAKYEHIQTVDQGLNVGHPELGTLIVDQGNRTAKGFEAEFSAAPMRGLTFNGGLGYTHVKITELNPLYGTPATFLPTDQPKWTANLAAQYESEPVFGEARVTARADAVWHSKIFVFGYQPIPPLAAATAYRPEDWTLNARLALKDIKLGPVTAEVALWGKNLTDNDGPLFPIAFGGRAPFLVSTNYETARTFGLDLIFNY